MAKLITFNHDEISEITKNFSEHRMIGNPGAFGQVFKGQMKKDKYPDCPGKVSVKVSKLKDEYRRKMWEQEVTALGAISQINVIKLVDYADTDNYYALVYERAKRDLKGYKPSNKEELDALLIGAARGLRAVHSAGFIHWDIQSRNLLLMKDGTVKIADFGLATKRNEKMVYIGDRRVGVFNVNDTEDAKDKYDVFCFGSVLRELVLSEMNEWSPTKCSRRLLADECTADDPDERPSMDEVVSKLKNIQKEDMMGSSSKQKKRHQSSLLGSVFGRKKFSELVRSL